MTEPTPSAPHGAEGVRRGMGGLDRIGDFNDNSVGVTLPAAKLGALNRHCNLETE